MLIEAARAIALAVKSSRRMNVLAFEEEEEAEADIPRASSSGGVNSGVGQCACRESSTGAGGASSCAVGPFHVAAAAAAEEDRAWSKVQVCRAGVGGKAALTQSCADVDTAAGRNIACACPCPADDVGTGERRVSEG